MKKKKRGSQHAINQLNTLKGVPILGKAIL